MTLNTRHMCAPENMSLLNPGEFRIYVHKAPYLSFFAQTVSLPSINLPTTKHENPFTPIAMPGDHILWDPLSVVFLVDEDLKGYIEIYSWMRGLGFPESYEEYESYIADFVDSSRLQAVSSPISVVTNTGSRNANVEFFFDEAIPMMVSAPTLSTDQEGLPTVTAKAMFDYTTFNVRRLRV